MAAYSGSWCSLTGFPGTVRATQACPRSPLQSLARAGTAPGFSDCEISQLRRHACEEGVDQAGSLRHLHPRLDRAWAHAGWMLILSRYADGGFSGGSIERPALQRLLADVRARKIDVVVVYKVDRLTRSLADFAKLVELFDTHGVSFVS